MTSPEDDPVLKRFPPGFREVLVIERP